MLDNGIVNIQIDNFVEDDVHYINALIETPHVALIVSDDSKTPYDFLITPDIFAHPFYTNETKFLDNICAICDKLNLFYMPVAEAE